MFTGIIETTGEVLARRAGLLRIRPARPLKGLAEGESIALNGVCLTLDRSRKGDLEFRLLPETLRATTLGILKPGGRVNLERSLRAGSRVGGHLVLGHVDGKGKVAVLRKVKDTATLEISLSPAMGALLVPKGPITVDGVSLTIGTTVPGTRRVPGTDCFSVHLIRHTLSSTTLSGKRPGDEVNLEIDPVAKILRGML
ncbi:MAG: riboflavin synthase [Candidatus Omnitrophota bacterium]|nr:riboflavin synthase [Candidatus Omnitrophota bacterium]